MNILFMSRIIPSQVEIHQRENSNVTGTTKTPFRYILNQQPSNYCRELQHQVSCGDISIFELNQQAEILNTLKPTGLFEDTFSDINKLYNMPFEVERDQFKDFFKNVDIKDTTVKTILMNKIREYVQQGMTAYDEDINSRREKLRAMIQAEETELTRELVNQMHRCQAIRALELRKDIDERRIREEEHKHATVALKRHQQLLETSPDMRDKISREMTRSVKYSNLTQILEKASRLREERQLDTLWHEIMLKNNEMQCRREEEERQKRKAFEKDTSRILEQQMAGRSYFQDEARREREQERRDHERFEAEARTEEMRNLVHEHTKRQLLKRDLEEQLMFARQRLAEKTRQESEVQQKQKIECDTQLTDEKNQAIKSIQRLNAETSTYMRNLAKFKSLQTEREAELEAVIKQTFQDLQDNQDAAAMQEKIREKRIFEEFIDTRKDQLKMNRKIAEEKLRLDEKERVMNKKDADLDVAARIAEAARKNEKVLRYRRELLSQLKNEQMTKQRNVKQHEEKHQCTAKQQKEYEKLTPK